MSSGQSHTRIARSLLSRLLITFVLMLWVSAAWAQIILPTDGLFSQVDTLLSEDTIPVGRRVALSGDTAVVFQQTLFSEVSEVLVFERDPSGNDWLQTATLAPGDGTPRFGQRATTDGQMIVVAAAAPPPAPESSPDGANFVFERVADGQWEEVAKLTGGIAHIGGPTTIFVSSAGAVVVFERRAYHGWQEVARLRGEPTAVTFGTAGFAVSGSTAIVGAPGTPGIVYVFERHRGGRHAWGEVARLMSPSPPPNALDVFGASVAIARDNAIVSALLENDEAGAYVFSRDHGGTDAWGQVAALSLGLEAPCTTSPDRPPVGASVLINHETAVLFSNCYIGFNHIFIRIFERNEGGANAWGAVAALSNPALFLHGVAISGNLMLAAARSIGQFPHTFVYGRNQGAHDGWGEVARFSSPNGSGETSDPAARAISGDTVFVGSLHGGIIKGSLPIHVYVADVDRDGVRDGIDPCPRDPLNNVAGACQRASAVHPVQDELLTQGDVTSETRGRRQIITATFTNTSDTAVQNPFFEVTELTGGNVLLNGDAGRGGIGATLSPDVGDGVLSPGESMTVTFRIQLRTHDPFQFFVTFHGDPLPQPQITATAASQAVTYEASRAVDEDLSTFWTTNFSCTPDCQPVDPLPQSIVLNLGGTYNVTRVRYLPRQDGNPNGQITAYRIYTSMNGTSWTQVAQGPWAANATEKSATLVPTIAAYVRLEAVLGVNGYAGAAEINIEHQP
jgi:hypothetical protein